MLRHEAPVGNAHDRDALHVDLARHPGLADRQGHQHLAAAAQTQRLDGRDQVVAVALRAEDDQSALGREHGTAAVQLDGLLVEILGHRGLVDALLGRADVLREVRGAVTAEAAVLARVAVVHPRVAEGRDGHVLPVAEADLPDDRGLHEQTEALGDRLGQQQRVAPEGDDLEAAQVTTRLDDHVGQTGAGLVGGLEQHGFLLAWVD